jgi:hypothetical protein
MMADAIPGTAASAMRRRYSASIEHMNFFSQTRNGTAEIATIAVCSDKPEWSPGNVMARRASFGEAVAGQTALIPGNLA